MSRTPNYADVVAGTLGRVLKQDDRASGAAGRLYADLHEELVTNYYVKYYVQDDFTVAALVRRRDHVTDVIGVSKRNTTDPKNPLRGKSLALSRAIRQFVDASLTIMVADAQEELEYTSTLDPIPDPRPTAPTF